MSADRPRRDLLLIALVGVAAAAAVFIAPARPTTSERLPNTFSLVLRAAQPGKVQLFWNRYAGYTEPVNPTAAITTADEPVLLTFPFPAGQIVGLILRLPQEGGEVVIEGAAISGATGELVHRFRARDFVPARGVTAVQRDAGAVRIQPAPGVAPELELKFGADLRLPDGTSAARRANAGVIAWQRGWSAVLIVLGMALVVVVFRMRSWQRAGKSAKVRWIGRAVLGFATVAVVFSRRPDALVHPQFWAEDGVIFFVEQHELGAAAWARPYASYLHAVPRLAASLAALFPAAIAPRVFAVVALAAILFAVLRTASPRTQLPLRRWCGLAVVLVPNMGELILNVTNAQWFGAIGLLAIAISRPPTSRRALALDAGAVAIFGLSGPFAVFFLPLFGWRWWRERRILAWRLLLAIAIAAAVIQGIAFLNYRGHEDPGSFELATALGAVGARTFGQWLGLVASTDHGAPAGWGIAALVAWLAFWLVLPGRRGELNRGVKPMLAWAALIVLAGGIVRYRAYAIGLWQFTHVQRYFHLPMLVTIWLVLAALATPGWRRSLGGFLLAILCVRNLPAQFRIPPLVDHHWEALAPAIDEGRAVRIPINPLPWTVVLPSEKQSQ